MTVWSSWRATTVAPSSSSLATSARTGPGAQVKVHPVLGCLGLGYLGEPDVRAAPAGGFHEGLAGRRILVHVRAKTAAQNVASARASAAPNVTDLMTAGIPGP
jgi:hypothetical protein